MSVESLSLSPIEQELLFRSWCQKKGIQMILFDLDDTICKTGRVFWHYENQVSDHLATRANTPSLSQAEWKNILVKTNNQFFEKLGVNPQRWNDVVDCLDQQYPIGDKLRQEAKEILQQIYLTPLEFLEGAKVGLSFIKKTGLPFGIVTHANHAWTRRKYHWLNLQDFLSWDDVFIVDENGHKTGQSWLEAIRYFGQEPEYCAVVGDSPRSDINPVQSIGVKHCFLIEQPRWSIHNQPVNPQTKRIKNLSELTNLGIELLPRLQKRPRLGMRR